MRSILITGCSTGIGLAAARTLKTRGWRVLATARRPSDLERLSQEDRLEVLPLEMSDPASVTACGEEALQKTDGRLDALYNNAAFGSVGAMEDVPTELLRQHLEVNVIATHALTRLIIPAMRRQGHGRIVMCSSVLGFVTGPYRGAYSASKFALEAMSDALRLELAPAGIHVSILEPGPIESQFLSTALTTFRNSIDVDASVHRAQYLRRLEEMERGRHNRFRLGPDAVVACLVHALESRRPKARYRIGSSTRGAALLKRLLPDRLLDRIVQRV